jgi:hypothetical protein
MKTYKVICTNKNTPWIPSFEQWKKKLIYGEIYEVFAMHNKFQIIVKGKFENELGKISYSQDVFDKARCRANFEYL